MKVHGWVIGVGMGVVLGLLISLILNGTSGLNFRLDGNPNPADTFAIITPTTSDQKITPSPIPVSTVIKSRESSVNLAQLTVIPPIIKPGEKKHNDIQDILLLYDSANLTTFPVNFCKIAEYYGLLCKKVDLRSNPLTDSLLRDAWGSQFQLISIDAPALLQQPHLLWEEQIIMLKKAVEMGGVNLLIAGVNSKAGIDLTFLTELTDGAILGILNFTQTHLDWVVSGAAPNLTREFTGQVIASPSTLLQSSSVLLVNKSSITPVISARLSTSAELPIFVRWRKQAGAIYVISGQPMTNLDRAGLLDIYNDQTGFSQTVPLMMTIQATMGEEAWHSDRHFANLTIDGPTLEEPIQNLRYIDLLREMLVHNFHTTIAFIPVNWQKNQPEVVTLFQNYPEMFSLVQKGNNADGYEFYQYQVPLNGENAEYPARPYTEQVGDVMEGLARMELLKNKTGLLYERIMIFPIGLPPAQTLRLLKTQDYLASVNEQDVPLGSARPTDWDYGMYPANLEYESFPLLTRRFVSTDLSIDSIVQQSVFDLFLNKPVLFFGSVNDERLLVNGMEGFTPIADRINLLIGGIEWQSLGTILKYLYLEKTNDDGSVDIRMFSKTLILMNKTNVEQTYHITKQETLNISISDVTVNSRSFTYELHDGQLALDLVIPARSSAEIQIH